MSTTKPAKPTQWPTANQPQSDNPVCGHGVPIYGADCEQCDEANAESDRLR